MINKNTAIGLIAVCAILASGLASARSCEATLNKYIMPSLNVANRELHNDNCHIFNKGKSKATSSSIVVEGKSCKVTICTHLIDGVHPNHYIPTLYAVSWHEDGASAWAAPTCRELQDKKIEGQVCPPLK